MISLIITGHHDDDQQQRMPTPSEWVAYQVSDLDIFIA
jgi:hypothetical protein